MTDPTPVRLPVTRATVDELQSELDQTRRLLQRERLGAQEAITDRDRWRDAKPLPDLEAEALAGCLEAFKALAPSRDGMLRFTNTGTLGVERVLRFLADRHGVEWPTPAPPERVCATVSEDIRAGEMIEVDARSGMATRVRS